MTITFNTGPVTKVVATSIGGDQKMVAIVYLAGWVPPTAANAEKFNYLTSV